MAYLMRTRQEIKEVAKSQLNLYRGPCIGVFLCTFIAAAMLGGMSMGILSVVITPVLSVAACGFYAAVYAGQAPSLSDWFSSLFDNFLRKLGGFLWMGLWTFLWALLLYIPGVVKAISYSMTPYILADCPNVGAKDALRLSMRLTDGYKMDILVAELSFLGWWMLSLFTFGILLVLHVGPYAGLTMGGIYKELKRSAIENGVISPAEFGE